MSYKVRQAAEAVRYEAPGHYDMLATRLHNPDDVNDGMIVNGLSHFLPGGGADMAPAKFEMIYYVVEGEMTVVLEDDDSHCQEHILRTGDSVHFGKGTKRACRNAGASAAKMLTVMVKPQG